MPQLNKFVKIVVYVPVTHADAVRKVLADAGAGKMGAYDSCSFSVKGIGRFRPLKGAKPFLGTAGKIKTVAEERIETVCPHTSYKKIVKAVREVHPYEEPAIDVILLLNVRF